MALYKRRIKIWKKLWLETENRKTLGLKGYNICIGLSLLFGLMITALGTYLFRDSLGMMFNAHPLIFSILYLIVGVGCGYMARTAESNGGAILGYTLLTLATGALLSACVPYEKLELSLMLQSQQQLSWSL